MDTDRKRPWDGIISEEEQRTVAAEIHRQIVKHPSAGP